MDTETSRIKKFLFKNSPFQIVIFIATIILISNLNAIVDSFLHPEIPYFDKEHLIVGGVTGLVGAVLFGFIITYTRHLESALSKIKKLESILPICSGCKNIRTLDAENNPAWRSVESYIGEHTEIKFSHSICPECMEKLYP
ncbi:MAG: hypothetical protein DWQ05_06855 [Calditrichaeota bacterium]|nr:MAG: hypothetical protein DWQ05_06855 [Calditrichota bacterium]